MKKLMKLMGAALAALFLAFAPAQADTMKATDSVGAGVERARAAESIIAIRGVYTIEVTHSDGSSDTYTFPNTIMTEGKRYLLDAALDNSAGGFTEQTEWYVAVFDTNMTPAAADTYDLFFDTVANDGAGDTDNAHEFTTYLEGESGGTAAERPLWKGVIDGSTGSITNSADKATFNIQGSGTLYGACLVSHKTYTAPDSHVNTDYMTSCSRFGSPISVVNTDTVNVTITITLN